MIQSKVEVYTDKRKFKLLINNPLLVSKPKVKLSVEALRVSLNPKIAYRIT